VHTPSAAICRTVSGDDEPIEPGHIVMVELERQRVIVDDQWAHHVPTGYSFNLDGTAIYLTMASLFIATGMEQPMSIGEQIGLLVFMTSVTKQERGMRESV
jgi:hypothetical protein